MEYSEVKLSDVRFGSLYNISSSSYWGIETYATNTFNLICGSIFLDSKDNSGILKIILHLWYLNQPLKTPIRQVSITLQKNDNLGA